MSSDATALLGDVRRGHRAAVDQLFTLVYSELRGMAARMLRRERPDHTLQTTALVHDVYLKLVNQEGTDEQDRTRFCAVAARAMRQVLVDHARQRNRKKRGGGRKRVPLDSTLLFRDEPSGQVDVELLDGALSRLAQIDARAAEVVELRFFGGVGCPEIAGLLGISLSSVERDWRYARAWLHSQLPQSES